jgi:hypothetical protein
MHCAEAVLVSACIEAVAVSDFLQDHLYDPVTSGEGDGLRAHVRQAEGQLAAEPGVDESAAEEDAAAGER